MATSNDLLSYSIMNPHKTHDRLHPVSLPPLDPIIRHLPAEFHTSPVRLPPLTISNYTTNKYANPNTNTPATFAPSTNYTIATPSTSSADSRLTENNLLSLVHHTQTPLNGLGLLSATIASMAHHEAQHPSASSVSSVRSSASEGANSKVASVTSSSSVSSSPLNSPTISSASLAEKDDDKASKRRQRLGPSCDSCRSRKVKCNAEITILSKSMGAASAAVNQYPSHFSPAQCEALAQGDAVRDHLHHDMHVIVSNGKLIRFRSCKSCNVKGLACCFSKGFTKEDIMMNNKKSYTQTYQFSSVSGDKTSDTETSSVSHPILPAKTPASENYTTATTTVTVADVATLNNVTNAPKKPHKIAKKKDDSKTLASLTSALSRTLQEMPDAANTRKSSCVSCRKRKVKCVYNADLNQCEGCTKKKHECVFEKR